MALVLMFSLTIAFLRGGRLRKPVMGLVYPLVAALVQLPLILAFPGTRLAAIAVVCSYLIAIPFWWLNRRSLGMSLLVAGLLLNLTVISLNSGRMPVDFALTDSVGIVRPEGPLPKHQPITPETRFPYLGDVLALRSIRWVGSPGDVLIITGVFLFVQELMGVPIWLRKTAGR